jgi:hypothetical protein
MFVALNTFTHSRMCRADRSEVQANASACRARVTWRAL